MIRDFFTLAYEFEVNPSIWKIYKTKAFKNLINLYDEMTNIVLSYIENAIEDLKTQPKVQGNESILEKLLKVDKKLALVGCIDSIIGGVDTTGLVINATLYLLAKNQQKQEILREEIKKILPNKDDQLTSELLKSAPYLRAVIKESLRIYTPSSGNSRRTNKDLVLAGYHVPKGTEVIMTILLPTQVERQYKRPNVFIPERWLKNNNDPECPHAKDANPFSYLPFGFGARACIGKRIADMELEIFIARIIRNFKIEWNYSDLVVKGVLINLPVNKMKFKMTEI